MSNILHGLTERNVSAVHRIRLPAGSVSQSTPGGDVAIPYSNSTSVDFDGVNDKIALVGVFDSFPTGITIHAWVKPEGSKTTQNYAPIIDLAATATSHRVAVGRHSTSNGLYISIVSGGVASTASPYYNVLHKDVWKQVAITVDNRSLLCQHYHNGNREYDFTTNKFITEGLRYSSLIGAANSVSVTWDGKINEIAIWNKPLSESEIAEFFNSGVPIDLRVARGNYTSTGNLIAYYWMGDGYENRGIETPNTMSTNLHRAIYDASTINHRDLGWRNGILINANVASSFVQDAPAVVSGYCSRSIQLDPPFAGRPAASGWALTRLTYNQPQGRAAMGIFTNFTVSFWIKNTTNVSGGRIFAIRKNTDTADNSQGNFAISLSSVGAIQITGTDAIKAATVAGTTVTTQTGWHFASVAYTYGAAVAIYVDGYQEALNTTLVISGTFSDQDVIVIGRDWTTGAYGTAGMRGKLAHLSVHNVAFTLQDHVDLYGGATSGFPVNPLLAASYTTDRSANVLAYWRLGDGDFYPTAKDAGPSGLNLTFDRFTYDVNHGTLQAIVNDYPTGDLTHE